MKKVLIVNGKPLLILSSNEDNSAFMNCILSQPENKDSIHHLHPKGNELIIHRQGITTSTFQIRQFV